MRARRSSVSLFLAGSVFLLTAPASPGAFIFAGETNGIDVITHPTGYTGTGGIVSVSVCIDPSSPNASAMEIPVQNIVATVNDLLPTTGNLVTGGDNNVGDSQIDFESVALHEVGHCIGLAHPNLASESGFSDPEANSTKSTDGIDDGDTFCGDEPGETLPCDYNVNNGSDGVYGSNDDVRGDDVNLHWFRISNNNPFTLDSIVDSTTYARDTGSLPTGHNFATNADRTVAGLLLGSSDTEAVMQQGTFGDEAQRTLGHDDVATLSYGMSGLDELEGTSDDYVIDLSYAGLTTSCDVVLQFRDTKTAFAVCFVGGQSTSSGSDHITLAHHPDLTCDSGASGCAYFNTGFNWFFNDQLTSSSTISVLKKTIPDGDTTSFSFNGDVAGTIQDDQFLTETVSAGTHTSMESVPTGWSLVTIRCNDPDSTGDPGSATATFEVSSNEEVVCTFTNCSDSVQSIRDVSGQVVSTTETFEACDTITAGNFEVHAPNGGVIFRAGKKIVLDNGFVVETGASFRAEIVGAGI